MLILSSYVKYIYTVVAYH